MIASACSSAERREYEAHLETCDRCRAAVTDISGMPALDEDGKFAPGTFEEEADTAWASILAIAAASGCGPADFLYIQVLLADIGNYGDLNIWWRRQFSDPAEAPARLTFQAGALPFGAKIELQAVAAPPDAAG